MWGRGPCQDIVCRLAVQRRQVAILFAPPHYLRMTKLDVFLCLNCFVFARKIRVEYENGGQFVACPIKWLDNFFMRNFTNATIFDDTLPLGHGVMEVGTKVPIDQLQAAMEDWFQRKSYIDKKAGLKFTE